MHHHDSLQRFVFENFPIRGELVRLDATWRAVLGRREYPPPVREGLGEFMAAAALLAATVKFDGRLVLQARGNGPVTLLVVECTAEGSMRALAQYREQVPAARLADLLGNAQLVMTIEADRGKEPYQGIVELAGATVADALEHYFAQSEQLDTRLWLAADTEQAAGMLLQRLPEQELTERDAWARAVHLGSTLTRRELLTLPGREILHRLYHEEDIRLFSRRPVSFRCSCSHSRAQRVLRMLGHQEVRSILAELGSVGVDCEFCGSHYEFDAIDAEQLFAAAAVTAAAPTRH